MYIYKKNTNTNQNTAKVFYDCFDAMNINRRIQCVGLCIALQCASVEKGTAQEIRIVFEDE
jgi:hypothetical protein